MNSKRITCSTVGLALLLLSLACSLTINTPAVTPTPVTAMPAPKQPKATSVAATSTEPLPDDTPQIGAGKEEQPLLVVNDWLTIKTADFAAQTITISSPQSDDTWEVGFKHPSFAASLLLFNEDLISLVLKKFATDEMEFPIYTSSNLPISIGGIYEVTALDFTERTMVIKTSSITPTTRLFAIWNSAIDQTVGIKVLVNGAIEIVSIEE